MSGDAAAKRDFGLITPSAQGARGRMHGLDIGRDWARERLIVRPAREEPITLRAGS